MILPSPWALKQTAHNLTPTFEVRARLEATVHANLVLPDPVVTGHTW